MKKKNIFNFIGIIVFVVVIGFSFTACDDSSDNGDGNIINRSGEAWIATLDNYRIGYIFKTDGTVNFIRDENTTNFWEIDGSGLYSTNGSKLTITYYGEYDDDGAPYTQTLNYSVSGNTLTLSYSQGSLNQTLTLTRTNISIAVFTPPSNSFSLTNGQWVNGNITNSNGLWYSFYVTAGTTYRVWWNDKYDGDNTKTLDVQVTAFDSNGIRIFRGDDGWNYPVSFSTPSSGMVYILVTPFYSSDIGTFGIVYSTGYTRP